jgi:hypothetical protein
MLRNEGILAKLVNYLKYHPAMSGNRVVFFEQQVFKNGNFCNPGPLHAGKYCHYWKPINAPSQSVPC